MQKWFSLKVYFYNTQSDAHIKHKCNIPIYSQYTVKAASVLNLLLVALTNKNYLPPPLELTYPNCCSSFCTMWGSMSFFAWTETSILSFLDNPSMSMRVYFLPIHFLYSTYKSCLLLLLENWLNALIHTLFPQNKIHTSIY